MKLVLWFLEQKLCFEGETRRSNLGRNEKTKALLLSYERKNPKSLGRMIIYMADFLDIL